MLPFFHYIFRWIISKISNEEEELIWMDCGDVMDSRADVSAFSFLRIPMCEGFTCRVFISDTNF